MLGNEVVFTDSGSDGKALIDGFSDTLGEELIDGIWYGARLVDGNSDGTRN